MGLVDSLEDTGKSFDANDRTFELSDSLGSQISGLTLEQSQAAGRFNSPGVKQTYSGDQRPLTGSGIYDFKQLNDDEIDFEEDFREIEAANKDETELNEVVDNYKRILTGKFEVPLEESPVKSASMVKEYQQNNDKQIVSTKQKVINAIGKEDFDIIYNFLKSHQLAGTSQQVIAEEAKVMFAGNKKLSSHLMTIEGIVAMELITGHK